MTVAIAFQNLTLGYERHPAVHHLDTTITKGSLTAVIGPNGAGKSTLLKGLIGALTPLDGHIHIAGIKAHDIAYLPQQSSIDLTFPLSVIDLVAMGLWREIGIFGRLGNARWHRVKAAIAAVGLTGFEQRPISTLSGGQVQRMLFARLLLQDAKLILLDEPFVAIDSKTIDDLIDIIQRWHNEGRTVLTVLHDYGMVRSYFPQSLMLARELVAHGSTETVINTDNLNRARQMCEACVNTNTPHICNRNVA